MAYKTLSDIYDDVRFRTNTDSTSLANSDLLRIANKYFRIIMRHFVDSDEDFYAEISTFNTVANQQEYSAPADSASSPFGGGAIKILRIEVTYDGSNWKVLDPVNWREIPKTTQSASQINEQFSTTAPAYAYFDRNLFLFPIPTSSQTAGGRLFYIKRPNEMTATSDVPELPADFLDMLSLGMSIDAYENLGNENMVRDTLARFNARLADMKPQETNNNLQDVPRFVPANISYK